MRKPVASLALLTGLSGLAVQSHAALVQYTDTAAFLAAIKADYYL